MTFEAEHVSEYAGQTSQKLVVVAGPTGVGKTMLGVELARRFEGEVINADSRYLYRGFNIGTAKPDVDERKGVPHHLIDILDPTHDFSLASYQELANAAIESVLHRGRLPLLVGGTPLYVNAVIEGWRIPKVPPQPEIRQRLEREAEVAGMGMLSARLAQIDPVAAEHSRDNLRRITRALEIFEVTGERMSELEGKGPRPYQTLELGLSLARSLLHARLDRRVDDQIRNGLVEEVTRLLEDGVPRGAPAMSSIGYRQLLPYLDGEQTLELTIAQLKHDTHRYVRHQETWLRRNQRLHMIDVSQPNWTERAVEQVQRFVKEGSPRGLPSFTNR